MTETNSSPEQYADWTKPQPETTEVAAPTNQESKVDIRNENIAKAVEIIDRMLENNSFLEQLVEGRSGAEAVSFLRDNPEAKQQLKDYFRSNMIGLVKDHFDELGVRITNTENNDWTKRDAFTGEAMSSWDYVAHLATEKLTGNFDYKRASWDPDTNKNIGQHRHAADLLLNDLGNHVNELKQYHNEMAQIFEVTDKKREQLKTLEEQLNNLGNIKKKIIESGSDEDYANLVKEIENLQQQAVDLFNEAQQKAAEKKKELNNAEEAYNQARRSDNEDLRAQTYRHLGKVDEEEHEWKFIRNKAEELVDWFSYLRRQVINNKEEYDFQKRLNETPPTSNETSTSKKRFTRESLADIFK